MMTGSTPWKGKNSKELILKMKSNPIATLTNEISDPLMKKFINGCC
jgi:hypothetical protein